jgi:transposase
MRGEEKRQENLFHIFSLEERIAVDHPIRGLRNLCDEALGRMSAVFEAMYSDVGRPSVAPETLLKSTVLMALYSVRSENQFCEQLNYNLLFRWFLGLDPSSASFDRTVFSKNRKRLLEHEIGKEFLAVVVEMARERKLLSEDHFTVDGTLIESWASLKSFRPKGEKKDKDKGDGNGFMPRNPDVDFHGEKRSNETHASTTDPEARLMRKGQGKEAKLSFCGNATVENRNGLVVECEVVAATGTAEVESAVAMLDRLADSGVQPQTVAADKNYHQKPFVSAMRDRKIIPHVAEKSGCKVEGLDRRTTGTESYRVSQRKRKLVEQCFGFAKTVAGLRKSRLVGISPTDFLLRVAFATLNLVRITRLSTA